MKSHYSYITVLCFGLMAVHANAQSLERPTFANGGGTLSSTPVTLSFTIGEPVIGTVQNANGESVGQGFWLGTASQQTLNVNELDTDLEGLSYFPNPVIDRLYLKYPGQNGLKAMVYDITGKMVLTRTLLAEEDTLEFSTFSSGNYMVQIQNGTQKPRTIKVIKK